MISGIMPHVRLFLRLLGLLFKDTIMEKEVPCQNLDAPHSHPLKISFAPSCRRKNFSCRAGGKLIEVFARSPEGDNITASCTPPPRLLPLPSSARSRSSPSLRQQMWSLQFIRVRNSKFTGQANYQHNTSAGWDPNTEAGRQRDGCEEHQHLRCLPWPTTSAEKKKAYREIQAKEKRKFSVKSLCSPAC